MDSLESSLKIYDIPKAKTIIINIQPTINVSKLSKIKILKGL